MECVHVSTLSAWRHQFPDSRVPVALAVGITAQIAAALDHAHSQKIIHRDTKPANVMLLGARSAQVPSDQSDRSDASDGPARPPPQVKVLDFGLAAEIRSSISRVSKAVTDTAGTRPYMAPEQWFGQAQGPATDQCALAVLFYELVSGAVPFTSAFETNDSMVMLNVVRTQAPAALLQLSKAQNRALLRAFAKDPSQRFGSCADFIAALGGAKVAGPRRSSRRRTAVAAVLTVLVVLASLAIQRQCGSQAHNPRSTGRLRVLVAERVACCRPRL